MVAKRSVVVVGAGITGAAISFFLAKSGHQVTVLEKDALGSAVSGASLACITPHMIDLSEIELLKWSCRAWLNLANDSRANFEYVRCGQLRFIERESEAAAAARHVEAERSLGINSSFVEAENIRCIEPNLTGPVAAATYDPDGATVNPFLAVRTLLLNAKSFGAAIRPHTPVEEIEIQNGCIVGVVSGSELIRCDCVVLASGPWTAQLAQLCNVNLPILPRKAQCLASVAVPPGTIRSVVSSCEASGGVEAGYTQIQQSSSGQILFNTVLAGGLSEPGAQNFVPEVDPVFVADSIAQLLRLFPCLENTQWLRSWVRYEAVAPDQRFLIGPLEADGLFVAAGDAGTGFIRAPAVGQLISDMLADKESTFRAEPYAPNRFENRR